MLLLAKQNKNGELDAKADELIRLFKYFHYKTKGR